MIILDFDIFILLIYERPNVVRHYIGRSVSPFWKRLPIRCALASWRHNEARDDAT